MPSSRSEQTPPSRSSAADAAPRVTSEEPPDEPTARSASVYPRLLSAALSVLVVDQVTKTIALETIEVGRPVDLIEGAVSFNLSFNPGGVFGLGQGFPGVFLVATVAVTLGILFWARRIEDPSWLIPLGLVLGGGLGNVVDRVFRGFDGRVVDFIDLHVWPVFNVADMAIVTGVGLVLVSALRAER